MKTFAFLLFLFVICSAQAQSVVDWNFFVTKVAGKKFQIHLKAKLQDSWHIYAQNTPVGGPLPTSVTFLHNPLIIFKGKPKEEGELQMYHEAAFGVDVYAYRDSVDFVQIVTLRNNIKTNISGYIKFMVCTNSECLPPATVKFNLYLNP
jgi:DsbC/DsbD-like thiol-disulfide interchange protein